MNMDPVENQDGQHLIQHCVIIQRDEKGYGLTVTGDNPVYVQSVKEGGAAYRTGVQVGDKIIKVNGTLVTHYNHIEVVNLIKAGSYVALTLLGKAPAHVQAERQGSASPPATMPRDPVRDERTITIQRVLDQERQFYKKTREEYMKRPSEKLQKEFAESTTRIKAFEAELSALLQSQPPLSNNGPFSAPPGKTAPPTVWQAPSRIPSRCQSLSTDDGISQPLNQDPNALYDNYLQTPITVDDTDKFSPQRPSSPPVPPERKPRPTNDQLVLPEGPVHVRQRSSPDALFPMMNGNNSSERGFSARDNVKKKSFDDTSAMPRGTHYSKTQKNSLTSSLPRAWVPYSHENKAAQIDDLRSKIGSNINTSSPPATPTLSEPMEKRIRSDTSENFTNGDDDTQSGYAETNKSGVMHHGQSINSIISMEDDDFASDDEKD